MQFTPHFKAFRVQHENKTFQHGNVNRAVVNDFCYKISKNVGLVPI